MIQVTVGNNVKKTVDIVSPDTTLYSVLVKHGISTASGMIQLNGETLSEDDLDCTFEEMNITDSCYLLNVAKASDGCI